MNRRTATTWLLAALCATATHGLWAQPVERSRFAVVDVYVDSNAPVAAWQFELRERRGLMQVVASRRRGPGVSRTAVLRPARRRSGQLRSRDRRELQLDHSGATAERPRARRERPRPPARRSRARLRPAPDRGRHGRRARHRREDQSRDPREIAMSHHHTNVVPILGITVAGTLIALLVACATSSPPSAPPASSGAASAGAASTSESQGLEEITVTGSRIEGAVPTYATCGRIADAPLRLRSRRRRKPWPS